MLESTFTVAEASFSQRHEERNARIGPGCIPSVGIILKVAAGAMKASYLHRIGAVIRRHGILRTRFFSEQGKLMQHIFKEADPAGCQEICFRSVEEWEGWKDNLPEFS